jgi:hypothetical protein
MRRVLWCWLFLTSLPVVATGQPVTLRVHPPRIVLETPESTEQLLVFARAGEGSDSDVTRSVVWSMSVPGVAEVSPAGRLVPLSDGQSEVRVTLGDQSASAIVEVRGMTNPPAVSFRRDIIPILSKAGCNSGGCHGKAEGQNGFKLSVFGYDVIADYNAIVREGRGRRVFPASPDESLMLRKGAAMVPHGGGQKFEPGSRWYRQIRRWISSGMPLDEQTGDDLVEGITVVPAEVTLSALGSQQLRVTVRDRERGERCVTAEAEFQSNQESIAVVGRDGLIGTTAVPGEAAILVRYAGHVGVCRVTRPQDAVPFTRPAERNVIDRLVWDKLVKLRIAPSPPADDATFLRRVFIDTIGTLPTADEARAFLSDTTPDKRIRLVAELLRRPEYADYWAQRWSDLLQVDKDTITPQGAVAMSRWIRGQLERNIPYDQFARSILVSQGSSLGDTPAAFFQVQDSPEKLARATSQLFLGVRIECAQCHHHPFERWDQKDYFALSGFFTGVERKTDPRGGIKVVGGTGTALNHPRTGEPVPVAALGADPASLPPGEDARRVLAAWVTQPDNPFFARTLVNRLWAHYFGRGLVEPIDDLRATNPASNEPLLNALAEQFVAMRYDLREFTQLLIDSEVYQLSSRLSDSNQLDEQNSSHAPWKPLPAEVLLDAVSQATGVPEEFNGWPKGYRAIQVWDNKLPSHFLEVFGRPSRQTVCACERGTEPSIAQALHLMNSPDTMKKLQDPQGRVRQLANSRLSPTEILDEFYLASLSRFPTDSEREMMLKVFAEANDRRLAAEDILWTLLNTREFVFNH